MACSSREVPVAASKDTAAVASAAKVIVASIIERSLAKVAHPSAVPSEEANESSSIPKVPVPCIELPTDASSTRSARSLSKPDNGNVSTPSRFGGLACDGDDEDEFWEHLECLSQWDASPTNIDALAARSSRESCHAASDSDAASETPVIVHPLLEGRLGGEAAAMIARLADENPCIPADATPSTSSAKFAPPPRSDSFIGRIQGRVCDMLEEGESFIATKWSRADTLGTQYAEELGNSLDRKASFVLERSRAAAKAANDVAAKRADEITTLFDSKATKAITMADRSRAMVKEAEDNASQRMDELVSLLDNTTSSMARRSQAYAERIGKSMDDSLTKARVGSESVLAKAKLNAVNVKTETGALAADSAAKASRAATDAATAAKKSMAMVAGHGRALFRRAGGA
eukprot:TRINITY_DN6046_c0_g2_i1.p1 TRINITY_DN6046_c0_g2~~TRINITY_DN6046_c0_g2_i1.p1  ORF type:complete len:403 (-),score=74.11 TRINITY_DN6046_c0_g2_i1:253-1461(-)